jgi:septal ring-binding cell division protein DamX
MRDRENPGESDERGSRSFPRVKIILFALFILAGVAGVLYAWTKITAVKKEAKKDIQIPVTKTNPDQELTFYKNLKDKNENGGKEEKIVGLIPPSTSPPPSSEKPPKPALKKNGLPENLLSTRFTLQVASMKDHQKAVHLSGRLSKKGFPSYVLSAEIPGKGIYYRVRIGHYATRKAAEKAREQLKRQGEGDAILARESVMTKPG